MFYRMLATYKYDTGIYISVSYRGGRWGPRILSNPCRVSKVKAAVKPLWFLNVINMYVHLWNVFKYHQLQYPEVIRSKFKRA